MPDKNRYFIGIVPPSPIFEQVVELKQFFLKHFQSKASLNSPPHVTLHMPFDWSVKKEEALVVSLQKLATRLVPVPVELRNFGTFPPRTIYIHAIPTGELDQLQSVIRKFCKKELGLFNADYKDRPFHPHMTVAFRDLKKTRYAQAWEEFKNEPFHADFLADRICLLKHDGERWNVFKEWMLRNGTRS